MFSVARQFLVAGAAAIRVRISRSRGDRLCRPGRPTAGGVWRASAAAPLEGIDQLARHLGADDRFAAIVRRMALASISLSMVLSR
jgi:hypothetical protein